MLIPRIELGSDRYQRPVITIILYQLSFIFTIFAFCYNLGTTLKIFESFDGNDWPIKNAIRPLIPMVVILIRYFTL